MPVWAKEARHRGNQEAAAYAGPNYSQARRGPDDRTPSFGLVISTITLEYNFPAGDLRPDDFRGLLLYLASMAEEVDDDLKDDFGGRRAIEFAVIAATEMAERDVEDAQRAEPEEATKRLRDIFG